jgi:TP901 family phage tail tape measure protein
MARTSATISVGADTRQLERDIQSALSRDFKFKGFNEKAFTQPLGRITGASNEFQKSLDASNARVIAFGASAGSIFAVEKAFVNLIKSTIDVQKSLTDINVILNTTSKGLEKFGGDLFNVAKDTGQSFDAVATAATELARQGLGVEDTLKRTRDALILTRLSGLDTVSSVEALTATLNSFNKTALDSTTVINKLANVDAAFAVSSADLANAVQRVGSSAQDAGVGFDELLAIVTSVQQTTSRGGAVIGNSLKTIFTRIARPEVLDQLQNLGLEVRNLDGGTRPAIDILKELSSTFDTLSDSQKSQIAETVGGVFQINILKAALGDLGKEYSVYNNALNTSRGATDQAIKRNEALNETLSAIASRTLTNFTQLGSKVGSGAFQPAIESTLKNVNSLLEGLANQDTESIGAKIGSGILGGLSTFISGPGLLLVTAVVGKLFLDLTKFAGSSAKTLLGIGKQATDRAAIEGKISSILAQEPQLLSAIASKQITVLDVENRILGILREQNAVRAQAAALSGSITSGLVGRGVALKGGQITAKSAGFIPNFAMEEIYGALAGGYKPGNIKEMNIAGAGKVVYNSAETVKRMPGFSQPAIMPPQGSKAGKNYKQSFFDQHGFNPYASAGIIPNFAAPLVRAIDDKELRMMLSKFGKGFAFQNISDAQSVRAYSSSGAGTYMWDANSRGGMSGSPQMSDKQAYKQNIKRAKNWASVDNSSWLVRYNRDKLKDSELLPDMETGGASVYLNPLNKDQIRWPIKQVNGPRKIFEKDIGGFLNGQINNSANSANGFVPNFKLSANQMADRGYKLISNDIHDTLIKRASPFQKDVIGNKEDGYFLKSNVESQALRYYKSETERGVLDKGKGVLSKEDIKETKAVLVYPSFSGGGLASTSAKAEKHTTPGGGDAKFLFSTFGFPGPEGGIGPQLYDNVQKSLKEQLHNFIKQATLNPTDLIKSERFDNYVNTNINRSTIESAVGGIFEAGLKSAIFSAVDDTNAPLDLTKNELIELSKTFKGSEVLGKFSLGEVKNALNPSNAESMADKIASSKGYPLKTKKSKKNKAFGFVPNFANDLNTAIDREKKAGVNPNSIRVGKDNSLISNMNPSGLGVYNTRDEPRGLSQGISRYGSVSEARRAGAAKGLIPNFALYSATHTEDGPVAMPASKEATAAFAALAKSVYNGKKTFDQANIELTQLAREFDLIDTSTGKVRNTLNRADASYKKLVFQTDTLVAASGSLITGSKAVKKLEAKAAAGGRGGELARGGLETARERRASASSRLQGIGIGASIAVPIVSQIAQEFMPNNKYAKFGTTALSDTAAFAGTGALFGPWGAAIGGLIGVTIGLTKAFKQLNDKSEELAKSSKESGNKVARFSEDVQAFLTSREKVAGVQSGAINAGPEDLAKLESQRLASFNRIFSSVSEGIQKELLAGLSGTEEQLQSAIQKANDEITSNNFVNQFIQNTNEQLKDGAKNLDITDTFRQLGSIKTKNGEYVGDLISQQDGLLKSFDALAVASEKYYGINDQMAKSIEQASIVADKATMSIDEFAKNDLFGFDTTSVRNAGEAPAGFGTTPYPNDPNNPPKNIYELNSEERQQRAYQMKQEKLLYEKDFQVSVEESGKGLKDFILQLGDSGKLQKDKALELADSIQKVLDSDKPLIEKSNALKDAFGNLRNTSSEVEAAFKRQESAFLNLSNLSAQTQKLFSPDPTKRSQASDFIQKGDFGLLVKDFLGTDQGKSLKQNEIVKGTSISALQGILGGTPDETKRLALERKFGETYKKAAQEIGKTGNLTDRTFAELQIAIQQTSMEASMSTKNLTELGSSIGDAATRTEVLNTYTEKESKLKKELGNNIVKLNYAASAAATSLQAVAAFKEGTIFADEYKQLQDKARQDKIRSGKASIGDALGSFSDEMTYGTQDAFREINEGASNTARTIKSEFNNAFLSFANGAETASDAFTKMALNISDKIQQLALEFATNQIFGSLFGSTSGIGGGIGDFLSGLSKSRGGMIKGYSSGGNVTGGSGNKDDVPAMLSGGEYVIRKNAVKKYGPEYLQMLNEGKVQKRIDGGKLQAAFNSVIVPNMMKNIVMPYAVTALNQKKSMNTATSPSPTYGIGMGGMKNDREDNYFKYGGRVQRFASGGESKFLGANSYRYNDPLYPTAGENVIDPSLSFLAVTDPNNPQNKIRQEREQALYDYLNYVESVMQSNRDALEENIKMNKEIQDQYKKQKKAKSDGAWMSFGLGVAGAGASQFSSMGGFKAGSPWGSQEVRRARAVNDVYLRSGYGSTDYTPTQPAPYSGGRLKVGKASGGYIRGFANGGSNGKDDIPALLMGGEFVMRKEAVNNYGKKFFDDLNSGRARKFANGGPVGNPQGFSADVPVKPTNNINISVNIQEGAAKSDYENNTTSKQGKEGRSEAEARSFANKIKESVIGVINEQQRPGGLLSSSYYAKK